jgi:hypothetical protein
LKGIVISFQVVPFRVLRTLGGRTHAPIGGTQYKQYSRKKKEKKFTLTNNA